MEITLRNYQPFTLTNDCLNYIKREANAPAKTFLELTKSVGLIALAILSLIPVFVADLLVTGTSLAYRACCVRSPKRKIPNPQDPPSRLAQMARNTFPLTDSKRFMTNALRQAFKALPPEKIALYKVLITDEGLPPADCNEFVDIFQWSAGIYLVHFLRNSKNDLSKLYPCSHPEFDHNKSQIHIQELQRKVRNLLVTFGLRSEEERNTALRKIISPEIDLKPEDDVKNLVNAINEIAVLMTQDPYFMKNIYTEVKTL